MESVVGITKYYKSIFHNKIMYNEIGGILKCIDKIPYAVIKGEPLSLFAYGDFGYRNCNDIDILISRDNIKLLEKMLKQNNFEQKTVEDMNNRYLRILCLSFSHQLLPYKKYFNDLPITIDLNFDVFWGEFTNKCIDIDEFLSDVIYIEVYGYKIKTLPPIKALLQLCLHHYRELNSIYLLIRHNKINVNSFKDIYFLIINNQKEITLDKLYNICSKYKINNYIYFVLYYTYHIFKNEILLDYLEAFRSHEAEELLDYYGLADNERKKWKVSLEQRLNCQNIYELIKEDLNSDDLEKIQLNKKLFG